MAWWSAAVEMQIGKICFPRNGLVVAPERLLVAPKRL
jgi:hypothetical protein